MSKLDHNCLDKRPVYVNELSKMERKCILVDRVFAQRFEYIVEFGLNCLSLPLALRKRRGPYRLVGSSCP